MGACRERLELRGEILDGRYRIGRAIATGGTGIVFEAERLATLEPVVVKALRPTYVGNPDLSARLRREVEVARRVFHPGIVPIIDQGDLGDGSPYFVMKYMRSESLSAYLRRCGTLSEPQAAVVAASVSSILHSVHRRGYVHRDVKPEHILLDRAEYGELEVHLLDFGVCAAESAPAAEKSRERGRVYGTPSYASPEQACGNPYVDARADLFGLGVTLFEALTGQLPFSGPDVNSILRRIIREDAPRAGLINMEVDREMDEVVAKLLSRNPEARYPSARSLIRALQPWLENRMDIERDFAARLQTGAKTVSMSRTVDHGVVAA